MNRLFSAVQSAAVLLMLSICGATLACDYPVEDVNVPDGASATEDEMLEARRAVKEYVDLMQTYLSCIEGRMDEARLALQDASLSEEDRQTTAGGLRVLEQKYDAAYDEMGEVAAEFNIQRQAYLDAQE